MNYIICKEPATFFCEDLNVKIFDEKNNIFYTHPNKENKLTFNLPVGKFQTNNIIFKKNIFLPYENLAENYFRILPTKFKIIVCDNENKATINTSKLTIRLDKEIANHIYKPVKTFIIGHEIGHIIFGGDLYDSEKNILFDAEQACDEFAKNYMLSKGYNPTQIKIAANLLLNNSERKKCIHNLTVNKKIRR